MIKLEKLHFRGKICEKNIATVMNSPTFTKGNGAPGRDVALIMSRPPRLRTIVLLDAFYTTAMEQRAADNFSSLMSDVFPSSKLIPNTRGETES